MLTMQVISYVLNADGPIVELIYIYSHIRFQRGVAPRHGMAIRRDGRSGVEINLI